MTVKEHIIKSTKLALKDRIYKLEDMQAPSVVIDAEKRNLENIENIKISGELELLEEEFETVEQRKGRGGVVYYRYNGNINYFPKAKYGRYISKSK